MEIKERFIMSVYSSLVVSLLLTCYVSNCCRAAPAAQSTNPCVALKLPLCRLKSDFANEHGIKTTPTPATVTDNQHLVKADDGTSSLSIVRPKSVPSNRETNDSCKGLRFCVLKKDGAPEKRRPDTGSTFVPTVRTPEELSFLQGDLSPSTFPSLLTLIRDNKLEEAKQYIEEGADVNEEDQHGNTLLLIAAQNGRDGVVRELLLGGADVNRGNSHKNAAIHLAAQNGWDKVLEILLETKAINVNFKDLHANTALHLAAQNGQIGIIQQLLDRPEIKLNSKNTHGLVPLHLAAQNGHVALTALLASKEGTNLNSKDLIGNTPLHTAYHTTHRKIANILVQLGANPNARNLSGLRPQDLGRRRR